MTVLIIHYIHDIEQLRISLNMIFSLNFYQIKNSDVLWLFLNMLFDSLSNINIFTKFLLSSNRSCLIFQFLYITLN